MKYLILILSCLLFLSGCVGDYYLHVYTDPDGIEHEVKLGTLRAHTNLEASNVGIVLPDGAIFVAGAWNKTADPNSALAWGMAFSEMIKAWNYSGVLRGGI